MVYNYFILKKNIKYIYIYNQFLVLKINFKKFLNQKYTLNNFLSSKLYFKGKGVKIKYKKSILKFFFYFANKVNMVLKDNIFIKKKKKLIIFFFKNNLELNKIYLIKKFNLYTHNNIIFKKKLILKKFKKK